MTHRDLPNPDGTRKALPNPDKLPPGSPWRASSHPLDCDWHFEQYPQECTCGAFNQEKPQ